MARGLRVFFGRCLVGACCVVGLVSLCVVDVELHAQTALRLPKPPAANGSYVHRVQFANANFSNLIDPATGIRLSIPLGIVSGPEKATWGNNWSDDNDKLEIDTLNFRGQRDLQSLHQKLRSLSGRRVKRDVMNSNGFLLQGTDADGTLFYVQCNEQNGEVRGISIVYSAASQARLAPIILTIVRSYEPFPNSSPPVPPATTTPTPPPSAPVAPQPPPPAPNHDANIARLQQQLEEMKKRLMSQEDDARQREQAQRRLERDEQVRNEERQRATLEAKKLEERLRIELGRKIEEAAKTMRVEARPAATTATVGPLPPGKRVAFVVGINKYTELRGQQLERAVSDARLMKQAFERLGFEVPIAEDVGRREFAVKWQSFLRKIEPGSTAAFFFAGHGVQLQGINYLLPRDIPNIQSDGPELLQLEALNFSQLYSDILARKPKVSLLILDACRNNPFNTGRKRSLGGRRGLTTVKPIEGSFVLYSANADEQALDSLPGDRPGEANSVFTRVLAPMLLEPDIPLQEIARRVRLNVAELAGTVNHKQWPSYYDGLTGNVCLIGNCSSRRSR